MPPVDAASPCASCPWATIAESPGRGRGVFATRDIPSRTVIDVAPVLVFSAEEYAGVRDSLLREYTFHWRSPPGAMALSIGGLGSLFNHRRRPNVGWLCDVDARAIRYIALQDIAAGEELFICYAPQHALWFEDAGADGDALDDGLDEAWVAPEPPF